MLFRSGVLASANQIVTQLHSGAPFNTVASQFSQSPSAAEGGDIGWVISGQLDGELDKAIAELTPGQTSMPIKSEGGYYILMLRDRREPIGTMIEEAVAKPVDPTEAIPLDRLLIPLPPSPGDDIKSRALMLASNFSPQIHSCEDLSNLSKQLSGSIYNKLGMMKPADLAAELRDLLLKTESGQMVPPFFSEAGLEVIMRCDAPIVKRVAFQLPTREELQQQLFVQQMTILGRGYLRDLRRDAVVENR